MSLIRVFAGMSCGRRTWTGLARLLIARRPLLFVGPGARRARAPARARVRAGLRARVSGLALVDTTSNTEIEIVKYLCS